MPGPTYSLTITARRSSSPGATPWATGQHTAPWYASPEDVEGIEPRFDPANDPYYDAANDPEFQRKVEADLRRRGIRFKPGITIRDVIKWANQGRRVFNLTPAGVAALIVEAAVIGAVQYLWERFETNTPLTESEQQLLEDIHQRAGETQFLSERAQTVYYSTFGDGALQETPVSQTPRPTDRDWEK